MTEEKNKRIHEILMKIKVERASEHVEALYDLISPAINHIGLKYLHDAEAAKELAQDFWADIYKTADRYSFYKNANAYLCRVATNMAINRYNKLKRENAYVTYVDYSDVNISDGNDAEAYELRLSVEQAMRTLDEVERIIIQSTYFEGKTVRGIAEELGMSKSQVGRLKSQALEKLKEFLLGEGK